MWLHAGCHSHPPPLGPRRKCRIPARCRFPAGKTARCGDRMGSGHPPFVPSFGGHWACGNRRNRFPPAAMPGGAQNISPSSISLLCKLLIGLDWPQAHLPEFAHKASPVWPQNQVSSSHARKRPLTIRGPGNLWRSACNDWPITCTSFSGRWYCFGCPECLPIPVRR
jgi:hypothetical protein